MATLTSGVSQLLQGLLPSFLGENRTQVTTESPGVTMTALKVPAEAEDVHVTAGEAKVRVPASVLATLPRSSSPGDSLLMAVASLDIANLTRGAAGPAAERVAAMVSIDLTWLKSGENLEVSQLPEPIVFRPGVNYTPGTICAYWDEEAERWSRRGVELVQPAIIGEPLVCQTWHLSFFAALVQGLVATAKCANLRLLNAEAVAQLAKGGWLGSQGSVFFLALLGALLAAFLVASLRDRAWRSKGWSDECLLLARHRSLAESEAHWEARSAERQEDSDAETLVSERRTAAAAWAVCGGCTLLCEYLRASGAARDAVDDIVSNWFENFSEVRALCEDLVESFDMAVFGGGPRLFRSTHKAMIKLTLKSSQRLAGATVGASEDTVRLVMQEGAVHDLVLDHRAAVRASQNPNMPERQGPRALSPAHQSWAVLYEDICSHVQGHVNRHAAFSHVPFTAGRLYLAANPLGAMWTFDALVSSKMRAFFAALEMVGALLITAVFFQASGGLRARTAGECAGDDEASEMLGYKVGRLIVIGLGSLILAELPVVFLGSLSTREFKSFDYPGCPAWQRQLRAWELQDRAIYVLGSCYLLLGTAFVALFLANLMEEDHMDFLLGCLIALAHDFVVIPLASSLLVPMASASLFFLNHRFGKVERSELLRAVSVELHAQTNVMLARESV